MIDPEETQEMIQPDLVHAWNVCYIVGGEGDKVKMAEVFTADRRQPPKDSLADYIANCTGSGEVSVLAVEYIDQREMPS